MVCVLSPLGDTIARRRRESQGKKKVPKSLPAWKIRMIYFLTTVENARREGPSVKPSNGIKWTHLCTETRSRCCSCCCCDQWPSITDTVGRTGGHKWTEVGGRKPLYKHLKMMCISTEQFETRRQTGVGGAAPETRRRF